MMAGMGASMNQKHKISLNKDHPATAAAKGEKVNNEP